MLRLPQCDAARLEASLVGLLESQSRMLGYPMNMKAEMGKHLAPFLDLVLNNLGDPYFGSSYSANTMEYEKEVLQFFYGLTGMDELQQEYAWGYVTSCGSEGNLKGISDGFRHLPGAVLYFSDKAHYSVRQAAELLRVPYDVIPTNPDNSIDVGAFARSIDDSRPVVLCLTIGTTMGGAYDNVPAICQVLAHLQVDYHLHVDAALAGMLAPFNEHKAWLSFSETEIDSVSISGHKMMGCPFPCGVYLTLDKVSSDCIEYTGSQASTLFGSRNGLAVLAMWTAIKTHGKQGFSKLANYCRETAAIAELLLSNRVPGVERLPYSTTVTFDRPSDALAAKWQLACEGKKAQLVCMPHVSMATILHFRKELQLDLKTLEDDKPDEHSNHIERNERTCQTVSTF